MPTILLSNPLGSDDAERIGLPDIREYAVGELINVDDFTSFTLIRTGYGTAVGTVTDILIVGTGTPPSNIGADGQWYLDTYSEVLWGPKVSGSWPTNPIRPDRGVAHLAIDGNGHLQVTYSTGTTVDLGYIIGPANVLSVGTVTTGAAGSQAAATVTGTTPAQQLNLTIPRGNTGRGFTPRGAWASGVVYAVDDLVTVGGGTYRALTAHTSGASFSGAGTNWEQWAAKGDTGAGFVARGAWASGVVYAVNDIVTNGGSVYRSLTAHTSGASFTGAGTNWELWAAKGDTGATGPTGPQGPGAPDATPSVKGLVQLAGELAGTAAAPTVAATAAATALTVVRRDGAGRLAVVDPAAAGDAATKGYVDAQDAAYRRIGRRITSGAAYTLGAADEGSAVETLTNATVFTVPALGAAFPVGGWIELGQYGTATGSYVNPASGVTIRSPGGATTLRTTFSRARLHYIGTDIWVLSGDLADDTGWLAIANRAGFTARTTPAPLARRVGKAVYFKGGWTNAGMAINTSYTVGDLPAGLIPSGVDWWIGIPGMSNGANTASLTITPTDVRIATGATLAGYYTLSPAVVLLD